MGKKHGYDKYPVVKIKGGGFALNGTDKVKEYLKSLLKNLKGKTVIAVDCYPGVREDEVFSSLFDEKNFQKIVKSETCTKDIAEIDAMISRNLTDDRVFGVMSCHKLIEFFNEEKIKAVKDEINKLKECTVLIYGVGASLIYEPDIIIYCDLARWEIQTRYRAGMSNWLCDNPGEDTLKKYKRGFFVEWRVADRHKISIFDKIEYFLDTTTENYKLMKGSVLREGLRQTARRPFRVVPFFDPGVWGGQWMKEVCGLPEETKNYAWCFDCVPEENSLLLESNGVTVEIPAIDLVLTQPVDLLGDKVHARFGAEFPIRFDFLDTMDGQNLSLQVHPLTEYIQNTFGMHYTQDESYYMLDAGENACVYLGVKTGTKPEELIPALIEAQETAEFDDGKFVNKFPAKKHDHFLIPAGTMHCSGANSMVLEISATPFIFTFKLWDCNRLGLDGKPRPVHIEHGKHNIQYNRDTEWVKKNLINRVEVLEKREGYTEERTGLHEREFIETRRYWFSEPFEMNTEGGVQVFNLVEGDEITISSKGGDFEPFVVHYAETFIIPASVGEFIISPKTKGFTYGVIRAYVRT